jgi:hypothetical protein
LNSIHKAYPLKGLALPLSLGDLSGTDDATLVLTDGEQIQINQAISDVKAMLIQDDGGTEYGGQDQSDTHTFY